MNIEIKYDPLNLPAKARIRVKSVKDAYKKIQEFVKSKRSRGFRLRYIEDYENRSIVLEARSFEILNMALRFVRDAGLGKKIPFGLSLANTVEPRKRLFELGER